MVRFYYLFSAFLVLFGSELNAQQGATLLTNYSESREIEDQNLQTEKASPHSMVLIGSQSESL